MDPAESCAAGLEHARATSDRDVVDRSSSVDVLHGRDRGSLNDPAQALQQRNDTHGLVHHPRWFRRPRYANDRDVRGNTTPPGRLHETSAVQADVHGVMHPAQNVEGQREEQLRDHPMCGSQVPSIRNTFTVKTGEKLLFQYKHSPSVTKGVTEADSPIPQAEGGPSGLPNNTLHTTQLATTPAAVVSRQVNTASMDAAAPLAQPDSGVGVDQSRSIEAVDCEIGGKTLPSPAELTLHGVREHECKGGKEYRCYYCSYVSCRKYDVSRHERQHTDERPFTCDVCSAGFRRIDSLKRHTSTHVIQPTFFCQRCPRRFPTFRDLQAHKKIWWHY